MTLHESQLPLSIDNRIKGFRDDGLMKNLPEAYTYEDILTSYFSDGGNNWDFAMLYGSISELSSQIVEETDFLEYLTSEEADNLLGMLHQLRTDISMTLEGAIDEISRLVTSPEELAEYIGIIPSSNLDELAESILQAMELVQMFSSKDDDESKMLRLKLNQNLLNKLDRIRRRLTQIEDLARLLQHLVRDHAQQELL